jgi:prepilin-type N-terminal cleavage/methylation domain-containing protein
MKRNSSHITSGFTLIELLVVIAIIVILAAMLLPVLARARSSAHRVTCTSNARQINLATRMYADDHRDFIPYANKLSFGYKESVKPYLGQSSASSVNDKVFVCPGDDFDLNGPIADWFLQEPGGRSFHRQVWTRFSSYAFNAESRGTGGDFGMAQKVFSSVREPSKTVLLGEISGFAGLSTHKRKAKLQFADAQNVMSFVDGHVSFIKMYWNGTPALEGFPFFYEPKPGYEYRWSGN